MSQHCAVHNLLQIKSKVMPLVSANKRAGALIAPITNLDRRRDRGGLRRPLVEFGMRGDGHASWVTHSTGRLCPLPADFGDNADRLAGLRRSRQLARSTQSGQSLSPRMDTGTSRKRCSSLCWQGNSDPRGRARKPRDHSEDGAGWRRPRQNGQIVGVYLQRTGVPGPHSLVLQPNGCPARNQRRYTHRGAIAATLPGHG
jgi:hypothetical protein